MDIILNELFGTWIGRLSLFTIGFAIAMGLWFSWWFRRNMNQNK